MYIFLFKSTLYLAFPEHYIIIVRIYHTTQPACSLEVTLMEQDRLCLHIGNFNTMNNYPTKMSFYICRPLVVAHKIDEDSPLYNLSPKNCQSQTFEIIITLEGTTPETSSTVQVIKTMVILIILHDTNLRSEHLMCHQRYCGDTDLIMAPLHMIKSLLNTWCLSSL